MVSLRENEITTTRQVKESGITNFDASSLYVVGDIRRNLRRVSISATCALFGKRRDNSKKKGTLGQREHAAPSITQSMPTKMDRSRFKRVWSRYYNAVVLDRFGDNSSHFSSLPYLFFLGKHGTSPQAVLVLEKPTGYCLI